MHGQDHYFNVLNYLEPSVSRKCKNVILLSNSTDLPKNSGLRTKLTWTSKNNFFFSVLATYEFLFCIPNSLESPTFAQLQPSHKWSFYSVSHGCVSRIVVNCPCMKCKFPHPVLPYACMGIKKKLGKKSLFFIRMRKKCHQVAQDSYMHGKRIKGKLIIIPTIPVSTRVCL